MIKYIIAFIVANAADLILTAIFLSGGVPEAHPVGEGIYARYGLLGLVALKAASVTVFCSCIAALNQRNASLARKVVIAGILMVSVGPIASIHTLSVEGRPMTKEEGNAFIIEYNAEQKRSRDEHNARISEQRAALKAAGKTPPSNSKSYSNPNRSTK